MALNGVQGLSSSRKEVRGLLDALADLIERSNGVSKFDDFHQTSAAIAGLNVVDATHNETIRLVAAVARVVASSGERVVRWEPGQGKQASGDPQSTAHLRVKGERLAMAMTGLQGLSWDIPAVSTIMGTLSESLGRSSDLTGKSVGMMMQVFRSCAGSPPTAAATALLEAVTPKLKGWSGSFSSSDESNAGSKKPRSAKKDAARNKEGEDLCITLRSILSGMARLDRKHPAVAKAFGALAEEVSGWEKELLERLDSKTAAMLQEAYRGELEVRPEVRRLLAVLSRSVRRDSNANANGTDAANSSRQQHERVGLKQEVVVAQAASLEVVGVEGSL